MLVSLNKNGVRFRLSLRCVFVGDPEILKQKYGTRLFPIALLWALRAMF